ncbi:TasA family protein [Oceanobacillus sp. CAU 1775]
MNLKKNIVVGMVAGLLGVALISGGTFAYFSDSVTTEHQIKSGIIDLDVRSQQGNYVDDGGLLLEFENIKPGDPPFGYSFHIRNTGTLNIGSVHLTSEHTILDSNNTVVNNGFDGQIFITELMVNGENKLAQPITLEELNSRTRVEPILLVEDIKADTEDEMFGLIPVSVEFVFMGGEEQNIFQGNTIELEWSFEAMQENE